MRFTDLHVHTTYSDGKNIPEEIVLAAIDKGLQKIGFSDHSYTAFDERYCIGKENIENYISEIIYLKEKYKNKIEILLGVEQDFYSGMPTHSFDYVIGSVHYLKIKDNYIAIDESPDILKDTAEKYFGGDIYQLIGEYYRTVSKVVDATSADIIGHFDLVSKFNEKCNLFDESDPRYVCFFKTAVDELLKTGKPFEINTGAISRGYRTTPYPAEPIIKYIKSRGGTFILSSDSHRSDTLCFDFDKYKLKVLQ